MKLRRTVPPAAAPLHWKDLATGLSGFVFGKWYLRTLEQELKDHFDSKHVFLVSSGKAALTIILKALQTLSPYRKEVLVPAYTCFSVPSAIARAGLRVAACDLSPGSFDFDYRLLGEKLGSDTLCVVSTHLFGLPADTARLKNLCEPKGIFVIEDAAQAMGGEACGKKLVTIGNVGFFSFGRGKNITCGSGGFVITNDSVIADALVRDYRDLQPSGFADDIKELLTLIGMKIFMHPGLFWLPAGVPSLRLGKTIFSPDFPIQRMSGMKTAVLRNWRQRLLCMNQTRQRTAEYFKKKLQENAQGTGHPFLRLPVLAKNRNQRDRIYLRGKKHGVSLMYPSPVNEIPELKDHFQGMKYPVAKDLSERLVALPTHSHIKKKDRTAIILAVTNSDEAQE